MAKGVNISATDPQDISMLNYQIFIIIHLLTCVLLTLNCLFDTCIFPVIVALLAEQSLEDPSLLLSTSSSHQRSSSELRSDSGIPSSAMMGLTDDVFHNPDQKVTNQITIN